MIQDGSARLKQFCIQWQVTHVLACPKFSSSNHSIPSQSPADVHSSGSLEILNKQRGKKNFLLKDFSSPIILTAPWITKRKWYAPFYMYLTTERFGFRPFPLRRTSSGIPWEVVWKTPLSRANWLFTSLDSRRSIHKQIFKQAFFFGFSPAFDSWFIGFVTLSKFLGWDSVFYPSKWG